MKYISTHTFTYVDLHKLLWLQFKYYFKSEGPLFVLKKTLNLKRTYDLAHNFSIFSFASLTKQHVLYNYAH